MPDEFNKHAFLPGASVECVQGFHDRCDGRAFLEDHDGRRPYSCHCRCHSTHAASGGVAGTEEQP